MTPGSSKMMPSPPFVWVIYLSLIALKQNNSIGPVAAPLPITLAISPSLLICNPSLRALAATYYANLSIFRSAPDTWAIDQLFPVMPIHRLHEPPQALGAFADLTCDSDGKLNRFIDSGTHKPLLELHHLQPPDPYWMGLFSCRGLSGNHGISITCSARTNAVHIRLEPRGGYQVEQVARGNTTADVLTALDHDPQSLVERLRRDSEAAIVAGNLTIPDAHRLIAHVEESLRQSTYLEPDIRFS